MDENFYREWGREKERRERKNGRVLGLIYMYIDIENEILIFYKKYLYTYIIF